MLITWAINTFAVLVAAKIIPGITYGNSYFTLILAALILGILNTMLRPILLFMALPLLLLTAGLFYFFINALLLYLVGFFVPSFHVDGFASALLGGLVISFISTILNFIVGKRRITLHVPPDHDDDDPRPPRRPNQRIHNGDDDVIDV